MNPQELAKLTLATSTMSDREIIENIYGTVLLMNGSLKSHSTQLRFIWSVSGGIALGMLTVLGFLLEHVL